MSWTKIEQRPLDKQRIVYYFEPFKTYHIGTYHAADDMVSGKSGFTTVIPEVPFWMPCPDVPA